MRRSIGVLAISTSLLAFAQVSHAACLTGVGASHISALRNPSQVQSSGDDLAGTQLALVKIAAVHVHTIDGVSPKIDPTKFANAMQPTEFPMRGEASTTWTGTLTLSNMGSSGSGLPSKFDVSFTKRAWIMECGTWDNVPMKPGEVLVIFVRPEKAAGSSRRWLPTISSCPSNASCRRSAPRFSHSSKPTSPNFHTS